MVQSIAVVGSPGAGKSTLARVLAAASGLPLIHLDREYWRPGWVEPEASEWRQQSAALVAGERWVIDGNYGSSLAGRLARAEMVVWLDLPTRVCVTGVIRRALLHRGRVRTDMREDCPERLDRAFAAFVRYVATFRRLKRPALASALAASGLPVVRLASTAERARFGRLLAAGELAAGYGMARLASSRMEMP